MKKLSPEQKMELNKWISEFRNITSVNGDNPLRYNMSRYTDVSKGRVKNGDQYIYDLWVNIEFKSTFDYYFYQMLKDIKNEIEKKNG